MSNNLVFISNGKKISIDLSQVKSIVKEGNSFKITLKDGQIISSDPSNPNLDIIDQTGQIHQLTISATNEEVSQFVELLKVDQSWLATHQLAAYTGAGLLAVGGIAAVASSSGSSNSPQPKKPVLSAILEKSGNTISGETEANAVVTVMYNGEVIATATAGADGKYILNLDKNYNNGELLNISAVNKSTNVSLNTDITAPDTTAPSSLTQALSEDNQTITGSTEAGAIVKVSLKGQVIGSATANADGTYKVVLDKAYNNGEVFNITASDKAGNSTLPNTLVAPDTTAPSSLSQTISQDGKLVSGTTEAGATVQVSFNGQMIGSATAGADGKYAISLNKAYSNGEILTVTASDKAGNSTSPNTLVAPDTTAPSSLTQVLSADNQTITGTTEAGAVVKVSLNGQVIGSTTATADGTYKVILDKAYNNGEVLNVTASDKAGNSTLPNTLVAPDTTAPSALSQTISQDGKLVSGTTEAGATVQVSFNGQVIGSATANADGTYKVVLDKAYNNGEVLSVTASDKAGNSTLPNTLVAPDTTAPSSLTQVLSADNQTITGSTEAGAIVNVSFNGQVIGSTTVNADGTYKVVLDKAYNNGEVFNITASDKAGNSTLPNTLVAPDTTAPSALSQTISQDGKLVSGTTEAGATVQVGFNGQVIGSATAGVDGKYAISLNKAYNNGEVLTVAASDKAGNSTLPNTLVAPDTTAPSTLSQTISQDGKLVSGTTEAGATVQVSFNGQVIGSTTVNADGTYKIVLDKAYSNGEVFNVTASDKAGNSTLPNTLVAPDTTAPSALSQTISQDGKLVSGTTEAGATVQVSFNGQVIGSATAGADGKYTISLNKAYNNGEILTVTASDKAGNSTSPNTLVAPDTIAPSSLTQALSADNQTITGTTEAGAIVKVSLNGQVIGSATANADGTYKVVLDKAYSNGEVLNVTASDKVGNSTLPNTLVAPDTTAPSALSQTISQEGKLVSGTTEAGATVQVSFNGQVIGSATANADGTYKVVLDKAYNNGEVLSVTASDKAGNSTLPNTLVAPDTTAPSSLTQVLSADNQTITGSTEAGAVVKVSLNGQVIGSTTANADGTYKVILDKAYSNGEVFNVTASDKAGNSTSPNTLVAPDTTAPSALSQTISQDGKLVSGTTEAGATVQVSFNGQVVGSATVGADGKYAISLNKAYSNGEILTVTASDKAGNSTSPNTLVAPDTTAPSSLTQVLSADNQTITGSTEAGAIVKVSLNGQVIGSTTVNADGTYKVVLDKAYSNGEVLNITASDKAGNSTSPNTLVTPDTTAPSSLSQTISQDGKLVSGTTEAGAIVKVSFNGQVIGSATAGADGKYAISLNKAYNNGEVLNVTASDKAGNNTLPNTLVAPDTTAPSSLTQVLSADHQTITGSTEAGAIVKVSLNGQVIGSATANADGTYKVVLDKAYSNGEVFNVTASDKAGNTIAVKTYAPIEQLPNINLDIELDAVFDTVFETRPVNLIDQSTSGYINQTFSFEVTGTDTSIILNLSNPNAVISGNYIYKLFGPGLSSSGSSGFSSAGSTSKLIELLTSQNLSPGSYSLELYVSSNSNIELIVSENQKFTQQVFDHYQEVRGNIFADVSGTVHAPENYYLKIADQQIKYEKGAENLNQIVLNTTYGQITINADGSYIYQSGLTEFGTEAVKLLKDQLNITITSLDGKTSGQYVLDITTDITPPVAGTLSFTDFVDTGSSNSDFITQDNSFALDIQGNEQGTKVEYQYSLDLGKTWQVVTAEFTDYLLDGQYSFRAKVSDAAGNVSYTESQYVTVDTTAPDVGKSFAYDSALDQIIFKQPNESYQVSKWVDGTWQNVVLNNNVAWDNAQYKVVATDVAGNSTEKSVNVGVVSGTYKPADQQVQNIIKGSSGDDSIYGGNGDDILIAKGGYDNLYGEDGNDTLILQDTMGSGYISALRGGNGTDTYIIDKQYLSGVVHIAEYRLEGDILKLQGYNPSELLLNADDKNLNISFLNSVGGINIYQQFDNLGISYIQFDDGTIWDRDTIFANTKGQLFGTENDDVLFANDQISVVYGLNGNDQITGGQQNDFLYGGDGDDILIAKGGYDNLYGEDGNDTLILQDTMGSGYVSALRGGNGTDTYIIDKQYLSGVVHIAEYRLEGDILKLQGYNPGELLLNADDKNLNISFLNSVGGINIYQQFDNLGISYIQFDDGTIWDRDTIFANTKGQLFGTENDDVLFANDQISVVYGLNGNDQITGGQQNDFLYGGDGDDILIAKGGYDNLYGEDGNDTLILQDTMGSGYVSALRGGNGTDTYIIDKQYLSGVVHIAEYRLEGDILKLQGYNPSELLLNADDKNLNISFLNSVGGINIYQQFDNLGISYIQFDDGTIWDRQTIQDKVANTSATAQALFADDSLLNILDQSADQVPTSTNTIVPMSFDIQSLLSPQNHTVDQIEVNTPQDSIILNESALAKASTVDISIQNNFIHPIDELIKQTTVLY